MIVADIRINGESYLLPKCRVISIAGISQSVSDRFEVLIDSVSLEVKDPDQVLFFAVRASGQDKILLEVDDATGRQFLGEVDPVRCTWDDRSKNTSLTASDPFTRAKEVELSPERWTRPGSADYTITEDVPENETSWPLDGLEGLWPGDVLESTIVEPEGNVSRRISVTVRSVHPEYGAIHVDKPERDPIPAETVFQRQSHELRFVPLVDAVDRIEEDLNDGPYANPVTLTAPAGAIDLEAPGLFPVPPPQKPDEPGTVILAGAAGPNTVIAAYKSRTDTGLNRGVVTMGATVDPVFSTRTAVPQGNAAAYPSDWARHVNAPPPVLLPSLLGDPSPDYVPRAPLFHEDSIPFNGRVFTTVDHANSKAYELREMDPVQEFWTLYGWNWGTVAWQSAGPILGNLVGRVRGLALDHVTNTLYMVRGPNGAAILYTVFNGKVDPVLPPVNVGDPSDESFGCLSLARWLYLTSADGRVLTMIDITNGYQQHPISIAGHIIHPHTTIIYQGDLFFIAAGESGTVLHRYAWDSGAWVSASVDVLLDYPALSPRTVAVSDALWIGANGQLWVWAASYTPMLVRADVDGRTAGDLIQSLLLISNTLLTTDQQGNASLVPRDQDHGHLGELPTYPVDWQEHARWAQHVERVVINGRDQVTGIAHTGIAGETLEIDAPYVETASHATAVAQRLLNWFKHTPREINGTITDLGRALPLQTFSRDGVDYQLLRVNEPLVIPAIHSAPHQVREFTAIEVLP